MTDELKDWFIENGYDTNQITAFGTSTDLKSWETLVALGTLSIPDIGVNPINAIAEDQNTSQDETEQEEQQSNLWDDLETEDTAPQTMTRELIEVGLMESDQDGEPQWTGDNAQQFFLNVVAHAGKPFSNGEDGIQEAIEYIDELGAVGREAFMEEFYDTYEDALRIIMPQSGASRVINQKEWQSVVAATGMSKGDISKAVRASTRQGMDWRVILTAHAAREEAGIEGTMSDTAGLVAEGHRKFGSYELAYLFASEWEKENAEAYRRGEAGATQTTAELMFTDPTQLTEEQVNFKDGAMKRYTALANSGSSFSSNEEHLNFISGYGYTERTPEVAVSEGGARETFRDLYQALFLTSPDADTLNDFQQNFEQDIAAWSQRENATVTPWSEGEQMQGDMYARPTADDAALGFLQDTDLYQDLFGEEYQKSGLTQEQYAARFGNYALGSFQDPTLSRDAGRAAMRSGNIEDIDRFASTNRGMQDPNVKSTLMRAAEAIRNM